MEKSSFWFDYPFVEVWATITRVTCYDELKECQSFRWTWYIACQHLRKSQCGLRFDAWKHIPRKCWSVTTVNVISMILAGDPDIATTRLSTTPLLRTIAIWTSKSSIVTMLPLLVWSRDFLIRGEMSDNKILRPWISLRTWTSGYSGLFCWVVDDKIWLTCLGTKDW